MARKVTAIPATLTRFTQAPLTEQKKRKVAAYARVSTDSEEQLTSYQAQIDYYTNYIKSREDWEFVEVYPDEGITGTSTKKREQFNRMIEDALAGKIDLIITKSVSRFARNTVDSLSTIRKLKEAGVEVYFEKENIWTFDSKGELLLTIMSSLAQEESRSISENCTWGQRKRFQDGKVSVPYAHFLGYDKGEDGNLAINEDEAVTVRRIFAMFLQGISPYSIARVLTNEGVPSPAGKPQWNQGTVRRMLSNEKYKGDALLQKNFTVDFLTKKQKKNEGEIPQYYVEGNHEPIITPEQFELVQRELEKRGNHRSSAHPFSSRVRCGQCGEWYGSKVWHSNDKYRRTIWRCNKKYTEGNSCTTPHLTEEELKAAFVRAVNKLLGGKDEAIEAFNAARDIAFDTTALEAERDELQEEIIVVSELIEKAIYENAHIALDQEEYQRRYDSLNERLESAKARYEAAVKAIQDKQVRLATIEGYINCLRRMDGPIEEFDLFLWFSLVDYITVFGKDDLRVTFKDGTEIKA